MIQKIYSQNNPPTALPTARGTIFGTCAGLTLDWARNVVTSQGQTQGLEQVTGTQPNMLRATQTQTTWAAEGANAALRLSEVQLGGERDIGSAEQGFASLASTNTSAGVYILTLTRPTDNAAHMVGVMKQDQNNFLYFEPNAGLFLCTSANEFRDFTRYNCQTNLSADPNAVRMSSRQLLNRLNQIPYPPTPALGTVPLPPHSYSPPRPQQTSSSNLQPQQSTYQVPPAPRQHNVPLPDLHAYPPRPRQSTSNSQLPDTNYRPPPAPQPRTVPLPPDTAPSPLVQQASHGRSPITEPQAAHLHRDATLGQPPQDTRRPRQRQQQLIDTEPRRTADMSTRPSRTANAATQQPEQPSSPSCCRRC